MCTVDFATNITLSEPACLDGGTGQLLEIAEKADVWSSHF